MNLLNRQGRKTAYGERFTAQQVGSLRRNHAIPRFASSGESPGGELLPPITKAAMTLGVAASTLHRWLNADLVAGEQLTPGAPWRIRITEELCILFVDHAAPDYVPVVDGMRQLGVSRQTVAACKERPTRISSCSKGAAERLANQSSRTPTRPIRPTIGALCI
jgi:hypothetical protein